MLLEITLWTVNEMLLPSAKFEYLLIHAADVWTTWTSRSTQWQQCHGNNREKGSHINQAGNLLHSTVGNSIMNCEMLLPI